MDSKDLIKLRYFYCSGKLRVKNIRLFTRSKDRNEEAYQTVLNAFMFPLRGRADICLDNQRFAASEGTLIYATSDHKIGFKVKSAEDFVYFNIYHNDVYDKNFCVSLSDYGAYVHDIQTYLAETATDVPTVLLLPGSRPRAYEDVRLLLEAAVLLNAARRAEMEERRVGKECRSRWSPYH